MARSTKRAPMRAPSNLAAFLEHITDHSTGLLDAKKADEVFRAIYDAAQLDGDVKRGALELTDASPDTTFDGTLVHRIVTGQV